MIYLVHHGQATDATVNAQRPLTTLGQRAVERLAGRLVEQGICPAELLHSGKLRARQTGNVLLTTCNPAAQFVMVRGLQPADPSDIMADRLAGEQREIMLIGHMPNLPRLLRRLIGRIGDKHEVEFPPHGVVALESNDGGMTWREQWRFGNSD
ncbi:MAG: phosphohistidine phosphatase SixA [Acidobacteriota bacterium]|nr:phosphohistidine phosphatase SixA [Acidobacteriota bacterium]